MFDVIIIGGGPAGLMCANKLDTKNYVILEKNSSCGKKLLLTGGGRCNVTNNKGNDDFLSNIDINKKYLYSSINLFGPKEVISFFDKHIKLKEEASNKMFPVSDDSSDILKVLLKNVGDNVVYTTNVFDILGIDGGYKVVSSSGEYVSKNVVVATGGVSFSGTGSSGDYIKFAKKFGIDITDLYSCECGIKVFDSSIKKGSSVNNVCVKVLKRTSYGSLMFTHNGLSGEAIMNVSGLIARENVKKINIDFLCDYSVSDVKNILLDNSEKEVSGAFRLLLTKNVVDYLFGSKDYFHKKIGKFNDRDIEDLIVTLKNKEFIVSGVNGIDSAYVTGGGVSLKFINTKSFESKVSKGLYFVGECLDLQGPIGGYNITIALSTGYSAASDINIKICN